MDGSKPTVDWAALDRLSARLRAHPVDIWVPSCFDRCDPAMASRVAAFDAECAALDDGTEDDTDEDTD